MPRKKGKGKEKKGKHKGGAGFQKGSKMGREEVKARPVVFPKKEG